jgi:hypothetical protein
MPARHPIAKAGHTAPLDHLVTDGGEKYGPEPVSFLKKALLNFIPKK